eukprot:428472-Rhodomonas_salina.1
MYAALKGHVAAANVLLAARCDPNAADKEGSDPCTLRLRPSILDPRPSSLVPEPENRDLRSQTLNSGP